MPLKLIYTAALQQTDNYGNPNGDTFTFSGSQLLADYPPTNTDLTNAATAMGSDISAKMLSSTGYNAQLQQDTQSG